MTSRFIAFAAFMAAAAIGVSCATMQGPNEIRRTDTSEAEKRSLDVAGRLADVCRETLGYDYPAAQVEFWRGAAFRLWDVVSRGHHGLIKARFEVRDGRIINAEILESLEQRGRSVKSARFMAQFRQAGLTKSGKLDRQVDGITGATSSTRAVKDAAVLALKLDALLEEEISAAPQ
jgi:hypothetical protein